MGLQEYDRLDEPVRNFMSAPLHVFDTSHRVSDVLAQMEHSDYHKIVVVGADQHILGIIDARHLAARLCRKIASYNFV